VVRTLVSDLRDVQLTLGCVPSPNFEVAHDNAPQPNPHELRVGPLHFPVFPVQMPTAPVAPQVAAFQNNNHFTRASMGAWDFSLPAGAVSPAPPPTYAQPPPAPPLLARVGNEQEGSDLIRMLAEEDSDEEDGYEYDDDMEDRAPRPKPVKRKVATPTVKRKTRGPKGMVENPICGHCNTKNTPEWRSGPNGMLLCNACGLKWSRKRQKPGNP
jgi:hypothetical protein